MPEPVPRVERKRCREDRLAGVLDRIRHPCHKIDNMCAIKGPRGDKVSKGEPVEHCACNRQFIMT